MIWSFILSKPEYRIFSKSVSTFIQYDFQQLINIPNKYPFTSLKVLCSALLGIIKKLWLEAAYNKLDTENESNAN